MIHEKRWFLLYCNEVLHELINPIMSSYTIFTFFADPLMTNTIFCSIIAFTWHTTTNNHHQLPTPTIHSLEKQLDQPETPAPQEVPHKDVVQQVPEPEQEPPPLEVPEDNLPISSSSTQMIVQGCKLVQRLFWLPVYHLLELLYYFTFGESSGCKVIKHYLH